VKRAADAGLVLTNKTVLDRDHIGRLPQLKYIGVLATGFNVVDIAAARERNIPVTNIPTYGTKSVAQMTFALILELTQHVAHHAQTVRDGRWTACPDFCYWDFPLIELDGLTLGVVGYGRIGRAVGDLGAAFGMKVVAYDQILPAEPPPNVRLVGLDELLSASDVVTLHCPLTPETKQLVNPARLARMKPTALIINTSRGPLVDEPALAQALARLSLKFLLERKPTSSSPIAMKRQARTRSRASGARMAKPSSSPSMSRMRNSVAVRRIKSTARSSIWMSWSTMLGSATSAP
jgi:glycerate dehydrogenase